MSLPRNLLVRQARRESRKDLGHELFCVHYGQQEKRKYSVHTLVYYEQTDDVFSAIRREKQLKKWYRKWKIELIEQSNPKWRDLYDEIV